jgi:hypothetical protein
MALRIGGVELPLTEAFLLTTWAPDVAAYQLDHYLISH